MIFFLFILNSVFAQPLSLQESLALVRTQNPEVQIARLQADQANFDRFAILTNALSVQASGSWLDFGEPLDSYLIGDENTEVDCTSFETFGFGDLCSSFSEPLRVREERIFDGSLQVALPISALYSIVKGHSASQHLHTIKKLEIEKTKQRIEISTIEIYMQTLNMKEQQAILEKTRTRLGTHQKSVQAFVEQGFTHPVQLQEIELAIQQTNLGIRQVKQGYTLLCQQMELILGLNDSFSPLPLKDNIQSPKEESLQSNLNHQISMHQHQAAQDGVQAAIGNLFPTVALIGATTVAQGQGPFTPTSQSYFGLNVQAEFGWGKKLMTLKQRKLDVAMTQKGLEIQQKSLSIQQQQYKQNWLNVTDTILLAQKKVEIENQKRVQAQAQFEAHQITISELLDAESNFSDAQLELLRTKRQSIIAQAKYQQSINADTLYFQP